MVNENFQNFFRVEVVMKVLVKFVAVVILLFSVVGENVYADPGDVFLNKLYEIYRKKGNEAIKNKKSLSLIFLVSDFVSYEIMKILHKGDTSILAIYVYAPDGEVIRKGGLPVNNFNEQLNSFRNHKILVFQIS